MPLRNTLAFYTCVLMTKKKRFIDWCLGEDEPSQLSSAAEVEVDQLVSLAGAGHSSQLVESTEGTGASFVFTSTFSLRRFSPFTMTRCAYYSLSLSLSHTHTHTHLQHTHILTPTYSLSLSNMRTLTHTLAQTHKQTQPL